MWNYSTPQTTPLSIRLLWRIKSSIPLTPEILEKNGFCPPPKYCGYHHLTVGNNEVFVCIDNGFSEFSHNSKGVVSDEECLNKVEISHSKSVHELQHALRLAGIEKEIEV